MLLPCKYCHRNFVENPLVAEVEGSKQKVSFLASELFRNIRAQIIYTCLPVPRYLNMLTQPGPTDLKRDARGTLSLYRSTKKADLVGNQYWTSTDHVPFLYCRNRESLVKARSVYS